MTRKLKLIIEYEGTRYHGWQVQPNGITIQGVLQKTLQKITREKTPIIGSGRTDAEVHAEGQVAHFSTKSKMTCREFLMAFNSLLPSDIVVREVAEVPEDFHAQFSAVRKIYRYTILNRQYPSGLNHRQCLFIQSPLDVAAMRKARKFLVGKHDFSAFRAANCEAKSPVRELNRIDIAQKENFIRVHFDGNGFLKHMVRNIMGTLILVGRGKLKPQKVREILESRDRGNAGPTAQPHGLCLVQVFYPD